ncbi:hypothetical protein N7491_007787 [Penicillium cf. griseofulvum]|nr:hypothetical protein N7491_007787 [Penicillium cf. griseofulvum]
MVSESKIQPNHNIVILGGSYGGISTAHYLLKHVIPVSNQNSYRITLVSASSQALCRQACPRALLSDSMFPQDKLFVDIPELFDQYPKGSFSFIHGTATELNTVDRNVTISLKTQVDVTEKVEFYALVIATGASTMSPLLGLNQDENVLRKNWAAFRRALPNAKNIVISGEALPQLKPLSKPPNPKVSITVITASSRILAVLPTSSAREAEKCLTKVGVTVWKNIRVTSVAPLEPGADGVGSKAVLTMDSGDIINADLYIPATGTKPNTDFIPKALLTMDGRVNCSRAFRVDEAGPRIYAIGDVASCVKQPAVHSLFKAIPILCANMKRDLSMAPGQYRASGEDRVFIEDDRPSQLVPIGKSNGVGIAMGYRLPSFLVCLMKGRDYWLWTTESLWSGKQWAKE